MGIGSLSHWLIVLVVVILVFGTRRIRSLGYELGLAFRGLKKGLTEPDEVVVGVVPPHHDMTQAVDPEVKPKAPKARKKVIAKDVAVESSEKENKLAQPKRKVVRKKAASKDMMVESLPLFPDEPLMQDVVDVVEKKTRAPRKKKVSVMDDVEEIKEEVKEVL